MSKKIKFNDRQKGIIFVIIEAFCFALMSFFVRMAGDLPTMQKCFFRNLPAVFIAAAALKREGIGFSLPKKGIPSLFWRCIFGASGMFANFYAIDRIGLADASMLNKMSPFFAMLISVPILKEKPGKADWIFTLIAFAGVLLVVKPNAGIASLPAFAGLYGGFGAGSAYVFVRKLGTHGVRSTVIVFCFSFFTCLACLPFLIFDYHAMSIAQIILLICAGIGGAGGQFGVTLAYKYAPAKEISVFDYAQVIFAAIFGLVGFEEFPDIVSVVGYAIIISVAVIRWNRKRETDAV